MVEEFIDPVLNSLIQGKVEEASESISNIQNSVDLASTIESNITGQNEVAGLAQSRLRSLQQFLVSEVQKIDFWSGGCFDVDTSSIFNRNIAF